MELALCVAQLVRQFIDAVVFLHPGVGLVVSFLKPELRHSVGVLKVRTVRRVSLFTLFSSEGWGRPVIGQLIYRGSLKMTETIEILINL